MKRSVRNHSGYSSRLAIATLALCAVAFSIGCAGLGGVGPGASDDCPYRNDGECDDGRAGAITSLCAAGSDPEDCDGVGGGSTNCLDNLDRFSGTYSLSVISRELGVQDYSTVGEDICGPGAEFFGAMPTSATFSVTGNSANLSVNINSVWYSASGVFQGPSAPVKPLVGGTFYETTSSVTQGVNSCGTESPYISDSRQFPEDGGQTTLSLWIYAQEDAIHVVAEVFWIADDSEILSSCHGVIIFQGTRKAAGLARR